LILPKADFVFQVSSGGNVTVSAVVGSLEDAVHVRRHLISAIRVRGRKSINA
jgi:hypothetical protein